jgi:hypothetical protein
MQLILHIALYNKLCVLTVKSNSTMMGHEGTLIYHLTNSVAPEPAGSSPYSQEPATGPYHEPTESTLHSPGQSP